MYIYISTYIYIYIYICVNIYPYIYISKLWAMHMALTERAPGPGLQGTCEKNRSS